jgi:hypothetical protein
MRTFHLERLVDISGVSGVGRVADGVMFGDGKIALHWESEHSSINIYSSVDDLLCVHGHEGSTKIVWDN